MTPVRACSLIVLVPLLGLAACGGSTKKVDPVADLALAKSAVLTAADVPGYEGADHTKEEDLAAAQKKLFADCMKVAITIFDDTPGAPKTDSQDFSKEDAQISNTIEIDPKKSDVDKIWDQMSKSAAEPCLQKLFESVIKEIGADTAGVTFGETSVNRFDPGVGTRSVGFAVKINATADGESAVFYAEVIFVQRDRAGLKFSYFNIGAPLDRKFETSLAQKVYDRIGDNAK